MAGGATLCEARCLSTNTFHDRIGRMRVPSRLILIFFSAALLNGCLPIPHSDQIAPNITGTVTMKGVPQAGIPVYFEPRCHFGLVEQHICETTGRKTLTNDQGRFTFKGVRNFSFFITLGDPGGCWEICFQREGRTITGLNDQWFGMYPPKETQIECDLALSDQKRLGQENARGLCLFKDGWSPSEQFKRNYPDPSSK